MQLLGFTGFLDSLPANSEVGSTGRTANSLYFLGLCVYTL